MIEGQVARTHQLARARLDVTSLQVPGHRTPPQVEESRFSAFTRNASTQAHLHPLRFRNGLRLLHKSGAPDFVCGRRTVVPLGARANPSRRHSRGARSGSREVDCDGRSHVLFDRHNAFVCATASDRSGSPERGPQWQPRTLSRRSSSALRGEGFGTRGLLGGGWSPGTNEWGWRDLGSSTTALIVAAGGDQPIAAPLAKPDPRPHPCTR